VLVRYCRHCFLNLSHRDSDCTHLGSHAGFGCRTQPQYSEACEWKVTSISMEHSRRLPSKRELSRYGNGNLSDYINSSNPELLGKSHSSFRCVCCGASQTKAEGINTTDPFCFEEVHCYDRLRSTASHRQSFQCTCGDYLGTPFVPLLQICSGKVLAS
jgi:hypothetical protein